MERLNHNPSTPSLNCYPAFGDADPETARLMACLEELLLNPNQHSSYNVEEASGVALEETEFSKTWVPGKATEIFKQYANGTLGHVDFEECGSIVNGTHRTGGKGKPSESTEKYNKQFTFGRPSTVDPKVNPPFRAPLRSIEQDIPQNSSLAPQRTNNPLSHSGQGLFSTTVPSAARPSGLSRSQAPSRQGQFATSHLNAPSAANDDARASGPSGFKTAYEKLLIDDSAKGIKRSMAPPPGPIRKIAKTENTSSNKKEEEGLSDNPEVNALMTDERLKNVEPKMVEAILNEVVELGASTDWTDIAGLEKVKAIIREIIIWPMQRPDIFTGLRGPPKGILLFGPPGTGKTMFGRLIATQSNSTFFNISASSLMSKWCGDGEKMVRALFQVARVKQPAVIFIDEIDSILTQRSDSEHETSRRLKTEFLIQFDGCATKAEDKLLVIGVTNRPQELDEAARRRLVKRIYIPLPEAYGRKDLIKNLLKEQNVSLAEEDYEKIAELTDGYSGADMASLAREAAYGPIRDIGNDIQNVQVDNVRPIMIQDFESALRHVKASVAPSDLTHYEKWDKQFGCHV